MNLSRIQMTQSKYKWLCRPRFIVMYYTHVKNEYINFERDITLHRTLIYIYIYKASSTETDKTK